MKRFDMTPIWCESLHSTINELVEDEDGEYVLYEEAQSQLADRDKLLEQREATILEQQARIYKERELVLQITGMQVNYQYHPDFSALKAALKAGRIKTLEELPSRAFDGVDDEMIPHDWMISVATLRRMANELKEQL